MVVKSKVGRKRYIVFKIESDTDISRYDLIYTLKKLVKNRPNSNNKDLYDSKKDNNAYSELSYRAAVDQRLGYFIEIPWVISINNNYGLIRCYHLEKDKTIDLLNSITLVGKAKNRVIIKTLGTTGTIRSARKKYLDKLNLYPLIA
jgi:RNase P/RNase MRP subunit POP5